MTGTLRFTLAMVLAAVSTFASASALTVEECFEGSDFIANAARARDNGIPRATFLERMEGDFLLIKAYPPELRWFAKDEADEQFLLRWARDVFDAPVEPERHRARFLSACLDRDGA